jgi:hypothetical protein
MADSPLRIVRGEDDGGATFKPGTLGLTMSLGEMMAYAVSQPEPKWIVPGYIPEGLTVLAGNSKIGKSYMCLDIAAAVASGASCLAAPVCELGDVLYVAAEDRVDRILARLTSWNPDKSTWPLAHLKFLSSPMLRPASEQSAEWAETAANPRLLILDTLARTIPDTDSRKGPYDREVERMSKVQDFASKYGIGVLVVTHTNQAKVEEGQDWMLRVSGTTGIIGTADTTMLLDAQRGSPDGMLHVTGRDIQDRSDVLRRVGEWWQVFDGASIGALGDRSVQIMDWACSQPAPVGPQDVSTALDIPVATINTYLGRLVRSGKLQRYGRGKYWKPGQAE